MYYQNYEDYMRYVLGYPMENQDTYRFNYLEETQNYNMPCQYTKELEDCYPEVYKMINPIVCEVCDRCKTPVTRDILENMVEEVYQRIEINNEISVKINIDNRSQEKEIENRTSTIKPNSVRNNITSKQTMKSAEVGNRQRRPNNPFLRDLIRILILNRLLGGGFFPGRPPRLKPPIGRPPFPERPRPPMPRDYDDYLKF